jgi:hypothetical protein
MLNCSHAPVRRTPTADNRSQYEERTYLPFWELIELRAQPLPGAPLQPLLGGLLRGERLTATPLQATGRVISPRYSVLIAACHEDTTFVVVCPDSSTACQQVPKALRVYTLDLATYTWALLSPTRRDQAGAELPLPRHSAACYRKGDEACSCYCLAAAWHQFMSHKACRFASCSPGTPQCPDAVTHAMAQRQHATSGVPMQIYLHGGVTITSGHGCISDLWVFSLATRTWRQLPCSGDRQVISKKVAAYQVAPMAACGHAMAVTDEGTVYLYGGLNKEERVVRMMQALVPLATQVPGGVPSGVSPATFIRTAPVIIGQAHARCEPTPACTVRTDCAVCLGCFECLGCCS